MKYIKKISPFYTVSFFGFLLLSIGTLISIFLSLQQQDIRQQAAGNTIFVSPGDNLTQKAHTLTPGDTLILHDGLYGALNTSSMHGTAVAPITIKAEHDGKAILDGNNGVNSTLSLNGSSYIIIDGFIIRNATGDLVSLDASDHNIIRRITGYNAGPGNTNCFSVSNGASFDVVEDSAAWGRCRYGFLAYHSNHIIFRRTWAKWEQTDNFSPAPRSGYGAYGSNDISFENVIGYNIQPTTNVSDFFTGVWETSNGPPTFNISFYGSMFYHVLGAGIRVNDLQQFPNTIIKDSFFDNPLIPNISYPYTKGAGIEWVTPITGVITNSVFAGNSIGINQRNGIPSATNNIFTGNTTAVLGNLQASNNDYWQNGSNGIAPGATDKQVDPGYDINTYGIGGYFFVPQNSPLKHSGTNGADIGANIIYEYENGQVTTKPLWPWPMEDRILAEKGISVTWQSGGGFWKTLNGVYGSGGPTPPPTTLTPTTQPSLTVTPTPTGTGATLSLSVGLHGIGRGGDNANPTGQGNLTPKHTSRTVTLTLFDLQNMQAGTAQGSLLFTVDSGLFKGTVTLPSLPTGDYQVKLQTDGFLTKRLSQIIHITSGQVTSIPLTYLINGDIDNNNQLDILDYNDLVNCFGSKQVTSSCKTPVTQQITGSDIDDDSTVGGPDYNLFLREISVQPGG